MPGELWLSAQTGSKMDGAKTNAAGSPALWRELFLAFVHGFFKLFADAEAHGVIGIDDPKSAHGGLGQERVLSLESRVDDAARGQRLDDGGIEGGLLAVVERGETLKQFVSGVPGNRQYRLYRRPREMLLLLQGKSQPFLRFAAFSFSALSVPA